MEPGVKAFDRFYEERRQWRSVVLKLLQKYGVDTTDWDRVNAFCRDPRIAGKVFALLSIAELEQLSVKLRVMLRKKSRPARAGETGKHSPGGETAGHSGDKDVIYILNLEEL